MIKPLVLATATAALLLTGAASVAAQSPAADRAQVEKTLRAAGYTRIHEVERDDGLWEADVTRDDGRFREVYVDPRTGEIFDEHDGRRQLTVEQVLAKAREQGLTEIHSLERDGALWSLEARNARNQRVEARLSAHDGRIVDSERDGWLD